MAARFVNIDHDTPLLLPPDLRQWVPQKHLVHFVMDAVAELDLRQAQVIKEAMGFRRFSLRGLAKVALEWTLVALAYNVRRLHRLGATLASA